jgi:hypothetical protein
MQSKIASFVYMTKPSRPPSQETQLHDYDKQMHEANAAELRKIEQITQRALLEAKVIAGPLRSDWTLNDVFPVPTTEQVDNGIKWRAFHIHKKEDPKMTSVERVLVANSDALADDQATAVSEIVGDVAVVLGAALLVQDAFEKVYGPAQAMRDLAARLLVVQRDTRLFLAGERDNLLLHLQNLSLTNGASSADASTAMEKFRKQCQSLAILDRNAATVEQAAHDLVESLDNDLVEQKATHELRQHGAATQFLAFLSYLGLPMRDIAIALGELSKREDNKHATAWETAAEKAAWENAAEKAADNVGERVRRAKTKISNPQPTPGPYERMGFQRRAVVLICRHVDARQPVSLRF